jgi:hypothetical protein
MEVIPRIAHYAGAAADKAAVASRAGGLAPLIRSHSMNTTSPKTAG